MKPETEDRLSSMMLWNAADEWVQSARALLEHQVAKTKVMPTLTEPAYFLVCQGLELVLKAFLRGSGKSEDFLARECGHNIEFALKAAENLGLKEQSDIKPDERSLLIWANKLFNSKALQFPITGHYAFPPFEPLLAIAEKLVQDTESFCMERVEYHTGKSTAVTALRSLR